MPKIVDHDQYRKELLARSFDLFAEKGYAAVTMRQIAKELSVSTGTLYHYFPSKEVLFEQLMDELTQQDILKIAEALQGRATLKEKVQSAFEYLSVGQDYYFKQALTLADFYRQQQTESEKNQVLKRIFQRSFEQAVEEIGPMFGIEQPELLCFVMSFVDGLIWQRIYGCEIDYAKQGEILADMLTMYIQKQERL
jgi:AcrR family transcriptional regulator